MKKTTSKTLQLSSLMLGIAISSPAMAQQYIIKYKTGATTTMASFAEAAVAKNDDQPEFSELGASTILRQALVSEARHVPEFNFSVATLNLQQISELNDSGAVEYIEVDSKRYLYAESTPYGISMVQAPLVSDAYTSNTKVCIIDTGYNYGHPDLPSSGVTGYAFSGHGSWSTDGNGHGTHVAGTIAAIGRNNIGVVGVNPSAKVGLHIVKIFNDAGNWTTASNLVTAIQSCKNAGAKVVNMSLGGGGSNATEQNALTNFYQGGMLLVAAAGNAGNSSLSYPASYSAVVSVAAVDSNRNRANYSQYNSQVEIAAPGSSVYSTYKNNSYATLSGTSMATPHVAGVAALVWSYYPRCTPARIRTALTATAQDRGTAGRDIYYGFGIVRAQNALSYLQTNGC